ncbi:helicase [Marasmius crinis-equi]|uniref:Helicase n=1 Tax=Marasmius crinis-equi TaxID=585013 RepID=A0ABR3G211_9AGAR
MPPFLAPQTTAQKRSAPEEDNDVVSKRPNLGSGASGSGGGQDHYWMVQWRNKQTRKNKSWEGDGVLVASGNGSTSTLYDTDRTFLGQTKLDGPFNQGREMCFGGTKDIMLDCEITAAEYWNGSCFTTDTPLQSSVAPPAIPSKPAFQPLKKTFNSPMIRKPTNANANLQSSPPPSSNPEMSSERILAPTNVNGPLRDSYWSANWRKTGSSKKKDLWEGDSYIKHENGNVTMVSEDGKIMGVTSQKTNLTTAQKLFIGGKEIRLLSEVTKYQIPRGAGQTDLDVPAPPEPEPVVASAPSPVANKRYIAPASFYGVPAKPPAPRHDPKAEGAIVMKYPTKEHQERHNKKDRPVVDVVLDPILSRKMRPHQHEGVKFLYECVMGLRKHEGQGCILADEMGLGKTLQTIALVWTLLKQNPYSGAGPIISKAMIVCPVSLINNWKAEFHKWLGRDRVGVTVCDKKVDTVRTFANSPKQQVLVVGYERLRTQGNIDLIGLIVCDEGHRLKSSKNKTYASFKAFNTPRRIILSGTPIQNDLSEFHAMADFCNPGLLDEYPAFKRLYENPIVKSRAPGCTTKEASAGEKRSAQLTNIAKSFVLRREATILGNYLPPKTEYVVFVTPSALQLSIFSKILQPEQVEDYMTSSIESLAVINLLIKVSSSPILLKAAMEKGQSEKGLLHRNIREAVSLLPHDVEVEDVTLSGKLTAVTKLLATIRETTDEKCVLVSHYTSTLNVLEAFCKKMNYSYFRLDGQTPVVKRQEYVNTFNKTDQKSGFIFLLSSKAGGVGINLIGGSRLCLIDSDWNPSHDLQSMARCHRDGQKRPVFIYRFLNAGTIDEKIFQRQTIKLGLSNALMGSDTDNSKGDSFTKKDLRDIFRVDPNTASNTHDLLDCSCRDEDPAGEEYYLPPASSDDEQPKGFVVASEVKVADPNDLSKGDREYLEKKKASLASLDEWKHIDCLKSGAKEEIRDELLADLLHAYDAGGSKSRPTAAADLRNIQPIDRSRNELIVRKVPGGTISFIFEKSSRTTVDEGSPQT